MELIPDVKHPLAIFAVQVEINGRRFPQGVGMTKKEAKTNAAFKAFNKAVLHKDDDGKSMNLSIPLEFLVSSAMIIIHPHQVILHIEILFQ